LTQSWPAIFEWFGGIGIVGVFTVVLGLAVGLRGGRLRGDPAGDAALIGSAAAAARHPFGGADAAPHPGHPARPRRTRVIPEDDRRPPESASGPTRGMCPPGQARSMSSFVIEAQGLRKSFGSTHALAGVDLSVRTGESLAIMGASGSGKTTLLHCLAGITAPTRGRSASCPAPGGWRSRHSASASVPTAAGGVRVRLPAGALIPELTAVENVALALMLNGMPRARAEEYGRGWLAALGLAGMEDRRIGQLSGGQAQRVAIARAQVTGAVRDLRRRADGAPRLATSAEVMRRCSTRRPARAARSSS
jgi:putative ABC transport system ATP-binding protein